MWKLRKTRSRLPKKRASRSCLLRNRIVLPQAGIIRRPGRKTGDRKPWSVGKTVLHSDRTVAAIVPAEMNSGVADKALRTKAVGKAAILVFSARGAPFAKIAEIAARVRIAMQVRSGPKLHLRPLPRRLTQGKSPVVL